MVTKRNLLTAIVLFACIFGQNTYAQSTTNPSKSIRCLTPAAKWQDGMVTGNGLIGSLHHGDPRDEIAAVNCHKFVVPNGAPFSIPDLADQLEPMRDLMLAGKIGEGYRNYHDEMLRRRGLEVQRKRYYGMLKSQQFHAGFAIRTKLDGNRGDIRDYVRQTDYETGEILVRWTDDQGDWYRRSFASRAANVLVTEIVAPSESSINGEISIEKVAKTPSNIKFAVLANNDHLQVAAQYRPIRNREAGYGGATRIVLPQGGTAIAVGESVKITNAPRVLLLTTVDRYANSSQQWEPGTLEQIVDDLPASYQQLHAPHVDIQRELFNRVEFSLFADSNELALDTSELIRREEVDAKTVNLALIEKLFYTSRYLFMASSGTTHGPRLCGMFTGAWGAAWGGDYTCDSNVNMAVFGGGIVDLPECMEGYYQTLERTKPQWREAAKQYWGCRGMVGPIRIDGEYGIPIHCGPYHAHFCATGLGPWLVYPMYEQYQITGDKKFLRERVHPFLKEMALFYEDFLTRRDDNGKVIFVPSNSPESAWKGIEPRSSAAINSTMDIAACKHCLTMLLEAEQILGIANEAETKKFKALLDSLPPYLINSDRALKEWAWESIGENYGHRHSSHMYPVWPAYEINPDNPETKSFLPAVAMALKKRDHTVRQAHDALQRSIAWIRIKNGNEFYGILKYMLENGYLYDSFASSHDNDHHTYNYDMILCLQGLLVETAVFTQPGMIELLPALPDAFSSGRLAGIKGRNQTSIDELTWDVGKRTVTGTITSKIDQELTLVLRRGIELIETKSAGERKISGRDRCLLKLSADQPKKFSIRF